MALFYDPLVRHFAVFSPCELTSGCFADGLAGVAFRVKQVLPHISVCFCVVRRETRSRVNLLNASLVFFGRRPHSRSTMP